MENNKLIKSINLEVHPKNSKKKLTWYEAKKYCKELGEGWRLPTIGEMFYLYEAKIVTRLRCWSSTDGHTYEQKFTFAFGQGYIYSVHMYSDYSAFALAVRDITE